MLMVAKFVVVPIFTWQAQIIAEIKEQEKKLGKTSNLLTKEDGFDSLNQQVSQQLKSAELLLYPSQKSSVFKLEQQKYFEGLAAKHKLTLMNFSWQANSEDKKLQVIRYQASVRLKGNISNLIGFITVLESQQQRIEIHGFNIPMKGQKDNSLGRSQNARFSLRFYVANQISTTGAI